MNSPNQFIPVKDVGNGDGEGSVQVHLDEHIDVAKAKVFAVYGKGGLAKAQRPLICRSRFPSSESASSKLAVTQSTILPSL